MGGVYFISNGHDSVKIGYSKNVSKRLKQLQTSSSYKLELLYVMEGSSMIVEKNIHKMMEQYRITNEWFQLKPVIEYLRRYKLETEIQIEFGYIK